MHAFRAHALQLHPDHGGDPEAFRQLVAERDRALRCARVSYKQKLYWATQQDRWVCGPCNNTIHKQCHMGDCECAHRDPPPPPAPRIVRDRNGLSEQEREAQNGLPFDGFESLKV